jgi:hydrogenase maturation protein HypF
MDIADRGICQECTRQLIDPSSRYFHYPLIHCNHCGPRYSFLENPPFSRSNTILKDFPPCQECQAEQNDPTSRRYQLETIICPQCGPQVRLERGSKGVPVVEARREKAVQNAQRFLAQGKLLAIQESWGFYLLCDATNSKAVESLRQRLDSPDRPLPVIVPNLARAAELCDLDKTAAVALESASRPVVILDKLGQTQLTKQAAPFLNTIGIRLPASGLEQLLFLGRKKAPLSIGAPASPPTALLAAELVHLKGIVALDKREVVAALLEQVDACLLSDLTSHVQVGDTVLRIRPGADFAQDVQPASNTPFLAVYPVRMGRGRVPLQVELPFPMPGVLAGGSDRQNTTCHAFGSTALLSAQNGDLKHAGNLAYFEAGVHRLEKLIGIQPEILAHDLDRQSLSTRYILERAQREAVPALAVQHHHAHLAACMAENGLPDEEPVTGVALDFGGLGEEPEQPKPVIWGGEFLVVGYKDYIRPYHLAYLPLPGGETAAGNLARTALAYLWEADIQWEIDLPSVSAICAQENSLLRSMLKHRLNTPLHSSIGRLFDAVASLAGLRQEVSYPNQALLEMEAAADQEEKEAYKFEVRGKTDGQYEIDPLPVIREVVADVRSRVRIAQVSARLHNGVAEIAYQVCNELRQSHNSNQIALSGEVWQNGLLLDKTVHLLREGGFQVYTHHRTSPNDACLSLGQAVIAGSRLAGK